MAEWVALRSMDHEVPGSIDPIRNCVGLHCTEPFSITFSSSWYDLINVERDVRHLAIFIIYAFAGLGGSVGCTSDWWSGGCGFDPKWVGNILSWRFDHEIFSMVIFPLPLIQEGQLSISGEGMYTILVNHLENQAYLVKVWLSKLARSQHDPIGLTGP